MRGRPYGSVLVANRGEIALRVIRAVREAGLRSIAVYSDADEAAPHVRAADEATRIGPTPAAASYLDLDAVIDAARRTGAEAIHPGYGFLSERAAFARAVEDAGLVFIGPGADVMEQMGRKDHARDVAITAGVPVTPRYDLAADDTVDIPADAYPVLVKAAAGGGGKGMRVVRDPADLTEAVASARRESAAAFGDDTLLVEKYVEDGRHVEVQVVGDEHGTVLHFFERDCSVQRRHQKVLEEAPAPTISDRVRDTLTSSAVALCEQVGYVGAGTVEFLVHGEDVYFLEMNTRLQVEHPVTELVTGHDLVQLQLRVAAGEPLGIDQDAITLSGHAFEARVYAEDPYAGFLPQAGRVADVHWPTNARVDAALEAGQEVGTAYDPMLGKVIVHGADRDQARRALVAALDDTAVFGLTTNVGFLRRVAAGPEYADAAIHTAWLDSDAATDLLTRPTPPATAGHRAAALWARSAVRPDDSPFGTADGWRSAGPPSPVIVSLVDELGHTEEYALAPSALTAGSDQVLAHADADGVTCSVQGQPWTYLHPDPTRGAEQSGGDADVVSPMPGTVLSVSVDEGATVAKDDVLGVVEAMKMELALRAPHDGTVTAVGAVAGDQVALGHVLFTVEPEEQR